MQEYENKYPTHKMWETLDVSVGRGMNDSNGGDKNRFIKIPGPSRFPRSPVNLPV